ncbi:HupE/UreJ family protein [Devosia ginsengisoli]|nr:HupE/UreJ family protein [Devosia ginsengisoli]
MPFRPAVIATTAAVALSWASPALAHGVSGGDAAFLASASGWQIGPYLYLGAKHMVTGYDHLLFLVGVVFFLTSMRDVALYVTMFSLGHSLTLLTGVLAHIHLSPHLVDAVIGLSVVYKAIDNLGGFRQLGLNFDPRFAVLGFGLAHGFGLATKLQDLQLSADGLVPNMVAFNVGVELGQILALSFILLLMTWWRSHPAFSRQAVAANVVLMVAGFVLFQYQLIGYFTE